MSSSAYKVCAHFAIALQCALLMLCASPRVLAITPTELRAALIFAFTKHTQWPQEQQLDQITIGFYPGQRALERTLREATEGKLLRGLPITIMSYDSLQQARSAQMLVLGVSENGRLQSIAAEMSGSQTLLVTEDAEELLHIMINLQQQDGQLSFEIHRPNMIYEGLKVDRDLILAGGSELDIAHIYKETEVALTKVKTSLAEQRQRLSKQQVLLSQRNQDLEVKTRDVKKKDEELTKLQTNLQRLRQQLGEDKALLDQNKLELAQQQEQMSIQQQQLSDKEETLRDKERNVLKNSKLIDSQQAVIDSQRVQISKQSETLEEKNATIEQQKDLLFYQQLMSASLSLVVALALYNVYSRIKSGRQLAKSNQALAETTEELRQISEAKSLFLSTMSHEIRTPMNGVLGMAELLRGTKLDRQQQRFIGIIQSSGKLLVNVINDILDYSKIEAGKVQLEDIDFEPGSLLYDCAASFNNIACDKQLDFALIIDPALPQSLRGDPSRISQILTNFLSNAFKFTRNGGVTVSAKLLAGQDRWRLSVLDTGSGITEQQQQVVFEAFTQADASINRSHGGTGLGLSICQRLAELMGGKVGVSSELGQGSMFWMEFPLRHIDGASRPAQVIPDLLSGLPVLVAIEREDLRNNLCEHIRLWGMDSIAVSTTAELWEQLRQRDDTRPVTVLLSDRLLDLNQPGQIEKLSQLPIIYICNSSVEAETALNTRPMTTQLQQPVNASMVFDAVMDMHCKGTTKLSSNTCDDMLVNYSGAQVLVAEDNTVNQLVIKGLLAQYGISPVMTENGEQALIELNKNDFDLVFMDCEMPVLDGYEACRRFRACEGGQRVPIVALTAHAMTEHKEKASAAGMDDHLAKPIDREGLEHILKRFCTPAAV